MRRLAALHAVIALAVPACAAPRSEVVVYAAASLQDVLREVAPEAERATGVGLVFNFGASNDLARQIVAAAKADLFIPADEAWMDRVAAAGLVDESSRRPLLSNRLVVIVPRESDLAIAGAANLAGERVGRLAIADPDAVPAGRYARGWLDRSGVWAQIRDRVVPAVDVRAALAAVESRAVEAGIVYATDAAISSRVRVALEVPPAEASPIVYPIAAMRDRPALERARAVAAWLAGERAAAHFERRGFIALRGRP